MRQINPTIEFYETYDTGQIAEIATELSLHHEIPMQYDYIGEDGGKLWKECCDDLENDTSGGNFLAASTLLLEKFASDHNDLWSPEHKLNIVDLGVGTGIAVKGLLEHIVQRRQSIDYVGIDISEALLELTRDNLRSWLGNDAIRYGGYCLDFASERFDHLLAKSEQDDTQNLTLFLGSTLLNFRAPDELLQHFRDNLSPQDMLLVFAKMDTDDTRRHINVYSSGQELPPDNQRMLDMLGFDRSLYVPELGYDSEGQYRYARAKLTTDVQISLGNGADAHTTYMDAGESILLWRAWHRTHNSFKGLLSQAGFEVAANYLTDDGMYCLAGLRPVEVDESHV